MATSRNFVFHILLLVSLTFRTINAINNSLLNNEQSSVFDSSTFVNMERELLEELTKKVPRYSQYPEAQLLVNPDLIQIIEINEREGIWTATMTFTVYNIHNDFGWNSSYYGIKEFFVPKGTFWTPTVVARNAIRTEHNQKYDTISLFHYGSIRSQNRRETYTMSCDFNVYKFPFDRQSCDVIFEAIEVNENRDLHKLTTTGKSGFATNIHYIEDDEWEVTNLENEITNIRSGYELRFTVELKRKPLFYIMILIIPIVTIYLLSGLSFFLPADTGEKVSFAMTVLLAQVVAFAALSDLFPASSSNVPLLLYFVCVIMMHMTLLCIMSVAVVSLTHSDWRPCMTQGLKNLIASDYLKYIGLTPLSNRAVQLNLKLALTRIMSEQAAIVVDRLGESPSGDSVDEDEDERRREEQKDDLRWRFLAVVADRVFLIVHIVILVTNLSFFSVVYLI